MTRYFLIFAIWASSSVFALACNSEMAHYQNSEDKAFKISFSKQKDPKSWSGVLLTMNTPHRKLEFEFTASNGYEVQSLVLLTKGIEQNGDLAVHFFDKNLKSMGLPQVGEPAPAYLFSPQLGLWFWYSGLSPQEYIPPAMWKLMPCGS
jgi:hypothetical protein